MQMIDKVVTADITMFHNGFEDLLFVAATGQVNTTGWTRTYLVSRVHIVPPADGIWDMDFVGDAPTGTVGQMIVPVAAMATFNPAPWVKGVRVHGQSNDVVANVRNVHSQDVISNTQAPRLAGNVIWSRDLATFDDSIQPTGTIHWSGFTPHVEMKKLHHNLTVVVEGPDANQINNCFNQAATAAIIAGIIAAYATAGAGLGAALSAFTTALLNCLGNAYSVRVDNHSTWVTWDT